MGNSSNRGKEIIIYARSISPSLGNKERTVATFISDNYNELAKMTIHELANYLNVSESTIIKVCKKLKCDGYHSLRKELSNYVNGSSNDDSIDDDLNRDDTPTDILEKVFSNTITALQDTLSILDKNEFHKAVDLFKNVNKVLLIGVGGSGAIADDISHKFLKVGIEAYAYRDTHLQSMAASLLGKNDIAIGISHSGNTKAVISALKIARNTGATTICVTNYIKSPITEVSDIKLVSFAKNSPLTGENAETRIVHLSILDALYNSVVINNYENSIDNLKKTRKSVSEGRINEEGL
jgi:DNA-binding MurR/RpiR family transcriptional regulator